MPALRQISRNAFLSIIILTVFLILSLLLRFDIIYLWDLAPKDYLVDNEPVLMNTDGYYYLSTAHEILEGSYSKFETNRAFPDTLKRSNIPPLLSSLLAFLSFLTGISLDWIGNSLPAILGLSIAAPLYLISLNYGGGHLMAIISCAFALLSPFYATRTAFGALDTDCLNVTFSLCCCYFFMQYSIRDSPIRYYHLGLGLFSYVIFLLWWDQAPSAVAMLSLSPLALGLLFFYRNSLRNVIIAIALAFIVTLNADFLLNKNTIYDFFEQITSIFSYISKQDSNSYPNIGKTISEQLHFDLTTLISATTVNSLAFLLSIFGLLWLSFNQKRKICFIIPIFAVGILSIFSLRFVIFLSPILAIGIGFFFSSLNKIFPQRFLVTILAIIFTGFYSLKILDTGITQVPKFTGQIISGMKKAGSLTPENSIIWSWWDEGHPLLYWSRRNIINDGMVHDGQRTSYTALPLQTDNFRLAANFMRFYAAHGKNGIQNFLDSCQQNNVDGLNLIKSILSAGPGELSRFKDQLPIYNVDWFNFFYPNNTSPIYLFLDKEMILSAHWIFWYGTWNPKILSGVPTIPMINIDKILFTSDGKALSKSFNIDYNNGEINIPSLFKEPIKLSKLTTTTYNSTISIPFSENQNIAINIPPLPNYPNQNGLFKHMLTNEGRYEFDVSVIGNYAVLQDEKLANSVLNRLFLRVNDYDSQYFEPIVLNAPHYQIWRVKGD